MRLSGIQSLPQMVQDCFNVIDVNNRAVLIQNLNEAAHMGSFEMMRQIDC